jgi:hypothetical protein
LEESKTRGIGVDRVGDIKIAMAVTLSVRIGTYWYEGNVALASRTDLSKTFRKLMAPTEGVEAKLGSSLTCVNTRRNTVNTIDNALWPSIEEHGFSLCMRQNVHSV